MAKKKTQEPEMTTLQFIGYYIKELLGAFLLIGFGLALYAYADDIGAWFGNKVQEAANYVFQQLGY
jgi:hypothetical protein